MTVFNLVCGELGDPEGSCHQLTPSSVSLLQYTAANKPIHFNMCRSMCRLWDIHKGAERHWHAL